MAYREETINKYMAMAAGMIQKVRANMADYEVSVSKGNNKIGKCLNVSLLPIITCGGNCKVCKGICYDIKACLRFPGIRGVLGARAKNTVLAMFDRERYFAQIDGMMTRRRTNKVMRWHVGGDIPDYDYLCRMIDNARNHPDFVIWTYTKQYSLVNRYVAEHGGSIEAAIPANLSIMFSVWEGLECENPYGFATFTCVLNGHEWPQGVHKCDGACHRCLEGRYGCPFRMSSAVAEH